jgi:hypothetical protein
MNVLLVVNHKRSYIIMATMTGAFPSTTSTDQFCVSCNGVKYFTHYAQFRTSSLSLQQPEISLHAAQGQLGH